MFTQFYGIAPWDLGRMTMRQLRRYIHWGATHPLWPAQIGGDRQ